MVDEIPNKLTDAWAEWVVQKLGANGENALSDEDIAAIIARPDSRTRARLNAVIATADEAVTQALEDFTNYTVAQFRISIGRDISAGDLSAVQTANAFTETRAAAVLQEAKSYADNVSGQAGVPKSYVDDGDTAARQFATTADTAVAQSANQYADGVASAAQTNAASYTDNRVSGLVSRETLDDELQDAAVSANTYADNAANSARVAAIEYADNIDTGVTDAELDSRLASFDRDFTAYARAQDNALHDTVTAERDAAIEASTDGISELIDGKLADNVTYTDTGDAETLSAAKQYTDITVAAGGGGGGGGVSQGYVDTGDSNTLQSAKTYADSGISTAYDNARTYADSKASAAQSGAVATAKTYTDGKFTDSGWKALTYDTGTIGATGSPASRAKNGIGMLKGQLNKSQPWAAGNAFAVIDASARPVRDVVTIATTADASIARIVIRTTGNIDLTHISGSSTALRFDNVIYPLD